MLEEGARGTPESVVGNQPGKKNRRIPYFTQRHHNISDPGDLGRDSPLKKSSDIIDPSVCIDFPNIDIIKRSL